MHLFTKFGHCVVDILAQSASPHSLSTEHPYDFQMAHIRQDFARQTEEIEQRAGKQMAMLRDQVDTQRRVEVHMTEEHKNNHIHNLEANHERAFANMKAYYNDITLGNVSVIKTLRVSFFRRRTYFNGSIISFC